MIKRFTLLLWISILMAGCLAKRQVTDDNLFLSPVPSMKIKVDDQIPYIGMTETSSLNQGTDDGKNHLASERHDTFYFIDADKENRIERFVAIRISNLLESDWFYIDNFTKWWTNPLRNGKADFGGHSYKTAHVLLSFKDGRFSGYFEDNGYTPKDCYVTKVLHRIPSQDVRVTIWHAVECGTFQSQRNKPKPSESQRNGAMVQGMDTLFDLAVKFLK